MGDSPLTLQCAKIILEERHQLLGVISFSPQIKSWCAAHSILHINGIKEFEEQCNAQSFDVLFSIVNGAILSAKSLKLPRHYAINYHNSPLPKYAGLYATSWAIMNGEHQHAVSWHVMEEVIDAGPIVQQAVFPVEEDETAFSLNIKCYEHAVASFRQLINEIATNNLTLAPQNASVRSYYGLKDKPPHFGFISWKQPAEAIDRLCRALTFGDNYSNQLATPKILINNTIFVIKAHKQLKSSSGLNPGHIIHASDGFLQIATTTEDIALLEVTTLDGTPCPIETLVQRYGLTVAATLDDLDADQLAHIQLSLAHNPKIEEFWVNTWLHSTPQTEFLSPVYQLNDIVHNPYPITLIPEYLQTQLSQRGHAPKTRQNLLLTVILIYLYRLNHYKNLTVGFTNEPLNDLSAKSYGFLSHEIPVTSHFDDHLSVHEALTKLSTDLNHLEQKHTFISDIFIRYPELNQLANCIEVGIYCIATNKPIAPSTKPLNIYFFEDCSGFYLSSHATDSSHDFLKQMPLHLLTLLHDALANPHKKLSELSFLSREERNKLLVEWNNTQVNYDKSKLLHHYIEEQVCQTPHNIAVRFAEQSLTYSELNQKANKVAHYLRNQGVSANHVVGICIHRSLDMIIGLLGILKAGAAYLPLDPNYPQERIAYMLENSEASLLLTDQELMNSIVLSYHKTRVALHSIANQSSWPQDKPLPCQNPSDLAYVIYTSGSTGKPKGVAITHQAICNHMLWMQNHYAFSESDVVLQKTSFSFDASVWEFFMPLMVGATLVIAPDNAHASTEKMIHLVQQYEVSVLQLVPSMLKELVTTDGFELCTSLKHVFCGGEVLTHETMTTFFKHNKSGAQLHNLYGPTEATIDTVSHTYTTPTEMSLIGRPISNTKVYVLDKHQQLVPAGLIGELYIAGDGLALGYIKNPQATEKQFITNPFAPTQHQRLYKTGDLVKWNAEGLLEYHGRIDNQVKIRGHRIELNEVESAIEKIPAVYQCIVTPYTNQDKSLSLSAYLVLEPDSSLNISDIRIQLNQTLPEYMIPGRFFVVERFATTPGGKLDRTNIPTPIEKLGLAPHNEVPSTAIEHELKEYWCTTLKIKAVGIHDDFFALGGNSLSAMQIIGLIQEKLSIQLTIRALFDYPTIHVLAKAIEQKQKERTIEEHEVNNTHHHLVTIKPHGNKTPLFLVHPIGGSVFWYKQLELYLDNERPLYALQDPGLDKHDVLFNSLEEMASYYIDAIKTIQPNGPYLLGGASFGSTVAIEMAKQLRERGERINAIVSLDGWAYYPSLQEDEARFQRIMKEQNARILKNYITHHLDNASFLLKLQWHREQMLKQYKLPKIQTRFILFKAQELTELFPYMADLNWWDNYVTKPIELHVVPGDHESMFAEPHIQVLGATINNALNKSRMDWHIIDPDTKDMLIEPM